MTQLSNLVSVGRRFMDIKQITVKSAGGPVLVRFFTWNQEFRRFEPYGYPSNIRIKLDSGDGTQPLVNNKTGSQVPGTFFPAKGRLLSKEGRRHFSNILGVRTEKMLTRGQEWVQDPVTAPQNGPPTGRPFVPTPPTGGWQQLQPVPYGYPDDRTFSVAPVPGDDDDVYEEVPGLLFPYVDDRYSVKPLPGEYAPLTPYELNDWNLGGRSIGSTDPYPDFTDVWRDQGFPDLSRPTASESDDPFNRPFGWKLAYSGHTGDGLTALPTEGPQNMGISNFGPFVGPYWRYGDPRNGVPRPHELYLAVQIPEFTYGIPFLGIGPQTHHGIPSSYWDTAGKVHYQYHGLSRDRMQVAIGAFAYFQITNDDLAGDQQGTDQSIGPQHIIPGFTVMSRFAGTGDHIWEIGLEVDFHGDERVLVTYTL